jgi:Domain of unknown function (DUF1937)
MTGFWFLGSPYSKYPGGLDAAFDEVVRVRGRLVVAGIPVFSPIIHSHPVALDCDIDPHDHAIWLPAERPMLDAACGLIILRMAGWEDSYGLVQERKIFAAAGKPEVFMDPDGPIPEMLLLPARVFATGAKRDVEVGKLDFDGSFSPYALEAVAEYMHRHNSAAHRAEENWKMGMPLRSFMKSGWRHFHAWWSSHYAAEPDKDAICGLIFNAMGYLHELTKPPPRVMLDEHLELVAPAAE